MSMTLRHYRDGMVSVFVFICFCDCICIYIYSYLSCTQGVSKEVLSRHWRITGGLECQAGAMVVHYGASVVVLWCQGMVMQW